MNKSLSTISGIIAVSAIALFSSTFEHKIDVFCTIMASIFAAWFILKNIGDAFSISLIISAVVTSIALYYGFTHQAISQAVYVSIGVWMLTLFKVIPFIVGLLMAGGLKMMSNKTKHF